MFRRHQSRFALLNVCKSFFSQFLDSAPRQQKVHGPLCRRAPRVEPLEDRRMLSVTLFVNDDAASGGDGSSWVTAYDNVQSALEAAVAFNADGTADNDVDAIWIAEGIYVPTAETDSGEARSVSFSLLDGVTLYGGFVGTEAALSERTADLTEHETVLSGALANPLENEDDAFTVVTCGESVTAALDGLTVTAAAPDSDLGAVNNQGTLTFTSVSIVENGAQAVRNEGTLSVTGSIIAENGGCGLWNKETLYVSDSTIAGNGLDGASVEGGVYNSGTATITGTEISHNLSSIGGGVANWDGTVTMRDCVLSENEATFRGGGVANEQNFGTSIVTMENCIVTGNTATQNAEGGGVFNFGTLNVVNSAVVGNTADADGGGIFTVGTLNVTNSTLAANTAKGSGGGICQFMDTAVATINNTILAQNDGAEGNEFFNAEGTVSGTNNLLSDGSDQTEFIDGTDGNLVGTSEAPIDPRFTQNPADGTYGDVSLRFDSPGVDAGDNALAVDSQQQVLSVDLDGGPRILNGTVDMGALESPPPIPGDLNLDGTVTTEDLDIVRYYWAQSVPAGSLAHGDPTGDGTVTTDDLDVVRANWGATAASAGRAATDACFRQMTQESSGEDSPYVYGPARRQEMQRSSDSTQSRLRLRALAADAWLRETKRLGR